MRARAWTRPAGEGVPLPEEEGFNKRPRGVMVKGFGQNVRRVLLRMWMVETNESCSNSFVDTVIGQYIPALGELGVRDDGAGDCLVSLNQ